MGFLRYVAVNTVGTLLRFAPLRFRTGVIKVGNPGRSSRVLLTCNYSLTVERVRRILERAGIDCYLLVANSGGINVWCSAAGGHLTNHQVISAIKTSGIEALVDTREIILPQLAASGVEGKVVQRRTGWRVRWGPVYAEDIPEYLREGLKKSGRMRAVQFPLRQRLEMAIMWAFPFSLIFSLISLIIWPAMLPEVVALCWIIPSAIFVSFPLYSGLLRPRGRERRLSRYTVIFDFAILPLIFEVLFLLSLLLYSFIVGGLGRAQVLRWAFFSFLIILLVSIDLMGSTPVYKSGLHRERFLGVALDGEKCIGCGTCFEVCPRGCFVIEGGKAEVDPSRCIQCGACIVQCPVDALFFKGEGGEVVTPESVRRYRLNLLGERSVRV